MLGSFTSSASLVMAVCLTVNWCIAYEIEISHAQFLQSIEFYKDNNALPNFLLNYDYSEFLEDNDWSENILRINSGKAFFDSVRIMKNHHEVVENHTGRIKVIDKEANKTWMRTFDTVGDDTVLRLDMDFVTASPLNGVAVIDTMQ
jgi:hypothetical protein